MRNLQISRIGLIFLMVCIGAAQAFAVTSTITFDFRNINSNKARVYNQSGFDQTFDTQVISSYDLGHGIDYTIELSPEDGISAYLQISISSSGEVEDVMWKDADGSQTAGQFESLGEAFFDVVEGSALTLSGAQVSLNISSSGLDGVDWSQLHSVSIGGGEMFASLSLFPGDYHFLLGNDNGIAHTCEIGAEIGHAGTNWNSQVNWRLIDTLNPSSWQVLPSIFAPLSASNTKLLLVGKQITVDYQIDVANSYNISTDDNLGTNSFTYFPGDLNFRIGDNNFTVCYLTIQYDPIGDTLLANPLWKDADGSMESSFNTVGVDFVELDGRDITIKGQTIDFNLSELDSETLLENLNGIQEGLQQNRSLFPGDYTFVSVDIQTQISFELNPDQELQSLVYKDDTLAEPIDVLHRNFAEIIGNQLKMSGLEVEFELSVPLTSDWLITSLGTIDQGEPKTFTLLPGRYKGNIIDFNGGATEVEFRLSNQTGVLVSQVEQKTGGGKDKIKFKGAGGNLLPYPAEDIWTRAKALSIYGFPGGSVSTVYFNQYAQLHRKPDGAWHTLKNNTLYFQYTGEYDQGALSYKLINSERVDINQSMGLNMPLQKEHGDNRFILILPSNFPNDHYTLEVTNEKNETFYLRFEVQ